MPSYSFNDVKVAITGPGGTFALSSSGNAEEGITIEMAQDKNTMQMGADGSGQHSLHASNAGTVTARFLKTSVANSLLAAMYDFQRLSSANWGQNVITITSIATGDTLTAAMAAFKRWPTINYAQEAGTNEWAWDCISVQGVLGFRA